MIFVITKAKHENEVNAKIAAVAEGIHELGTLHFPNQIIWTRFLGALQRGTVGMRDVEIRLDAIDTTPKEEPDEAE